MNAPADAVQTYLRCLEHRDFDGAVRVATSVLDAGEGIDEAMAVLTAAQHLVGERWETNAWSVAQEHAATAITDRVAGLLAASVREPAVLPKVIVVCAEGDWHTLPGRMMADLLRVRGWDARFLGGSVPARDLQRHLVDEQPLALAVTCALPLFLAGASGSVAAAHAAGVPVVAGGRAFGDTGARAAAIGADAWARRVDQAVAALQRWSSQAVVEFGVANPKGQQRYHRLRGERLSIVDFALAALESTLGYMRSIDERQRQRTREDLEYLLGYLEAAVLTNDPGILNEYLPWLRTVLTSRGVPADVLGPTVAAVHGGLLEFAQPEAAEMLANAGRSALGELPCT